MCDKKSEENTLVCVPRNLWPLPVLVKKKKLFHRDVVPKIHLYPVPLLDALRESSFFLKHPIALFVERDPNCFGSTHSIENYCILETMPRGKVLHVWADNLHNDTGRILQLLSNHSKCVLMTADTVLQFDVHAYRHMFNHLAVTDIQKYIPQHDIDKILEIGKN